MPVLDGYSNVIKAAEVLGVHPGTVKRLCREDKIAAEKVHNMWLIHNDTLHNFAAKYRGLRGRPKSKNRK